MECDREAQAELSHPDSADFHVLATAHCVRGRTPKIERHSKKKGRKMSNQANILIIGGSGHVSGAFARLAVSKGHKVWAMTRGIRPLPEGVTGIVADRFNPEQFRQAIEGSGLIWDMVVDCICFTPEVMKLDIELFKSRTKQFVFISTDFVFDPKRRKFPQPEDNPNYLTDDSYGAEKRRCELLLIDSGMEYTILRPCHIYGPPSELGCLPFEARDPELLNKLKAGEPITLVGGGYLLQQPIHTDDLAGVIMSVLGNEKANKRVFQMAGPDIIESKQYYKIIADVLGVEMVEIKEHPVDLYLQEYPDYKSYICHRIYDLRNLAEAGIYTPCISIEDGLRTHTEYILARDAAKE
jgi:nucleoside-diphosphate-sugar epimerase